ncbi:two-component system phosphate regulon sensor histidine kinase PhoR [Gillisia sp. Hel_I_86]|uniref:sensor histidine kinase n=1 Tax=Gillisia sp. Hel_I_86 TaxID=1249981 RepID=UPI00119A45F9|nr:HAMP domain-containing sensor histidine kinase [Gillisia sp. Hel_I_86]TVZ27230.1 two-component system phosphate regulon sensor histidine kinase PhoR [Gillisia sp. Hel_I_86]
MQNGNFKIILYFIAAVILITLGIQLYWNYKNFQAGKQQLINEVQTSLDNAIDAYYVDLADKNTIGVTLKNGGGDITKNAELEGLFKFLDNSKTDLISSIDSLDPKKIAGLKILKRSTFRDSSKLVLKRHSQDSNKENKVENFFGNVKNPKFPGDSVFKLASKIIISMTTDTLQTSSLNTFIDEQLNQKKIDIDYGYIFENGNGKIQKHNPQITNKVSLNTTSKSAYLPKNSSFKIFFTTNTALILKRNMLGLLLSAILIIGVMGCLLFLLNIINRQKQLAEMKNDLISNITHEFKTPISVIHVALEGMESFNKENDPEKNRNYLNTSKEQLTRLNIMVEKLLETAMLEGNKIKLEKSNFYIDEIINRLITKYKNLETAKTITFTGTGTPLEIFADAFHLENALNNILDNAVKYGGDQISVSIVDKKNLLQIEIKDDGNSLTQDQSNHIFEKFYRVPKGNTHDVKGYGIGLYYTKNIIEKHEGTIEVLINQGTIFKICLPHG